jgi:urea transporter
MYNEILIITLKGFSQVFFQENILMGLLIAIGLGIASPLALLLAAIGGITMSLFSSFFGVNKALYETGVTAFNGILIGCAMSFYIKSLSLSLVFVLVGSILGAIIFYLLIKNHITPFALPFIMVAFIMLFMVNFFKIH